MIFLWGLPVVGYWAGQKPQQAVPHVTVFILTSLQFVSLPAVTPAGTPSVAQDFISSLYKLRQEDKKTSMLDMLVHAFF